MPRKKQTGAGKALTTTKPTALQPAREAAHQMHGGGDLVRVDAIYHVPAMHPSSHGPWQGEADKIAWTDDMSGYPCVIRRSANGGHLGGYVAVPPGHPLYGLRVSLIVGFGIEVHGGISYAEECQASEPEETSICHVPFGPPLKLANAAARDLAHDDDAWWLGFECNRHGDVQPGSRDPVRYDAAYDGINERTYKTEAYVYRECVRLAAQLKAIELGQAPERASFFTGERPYDPGRTEG